jgi:GxxExxY protein
MMPTTTEIPVKELNQITEKIIGCAYTVINTLGTGFLEKVYENALAHEIRKSGYQAVQQAPIHVLYDGMIVGDYFADILVESSVIVELKVVDSLVDVHRAQCRNYLRGTGLKICLLINFGRKHIERERFVNNLDENES